VKISQRIREYSPSPATYLFAGVFLLRLLILARLAASPFLLPASGDMSFYNDWALRILRGQLTDHLAFYGLPGYAYLLALLYRIFGYSPFVPGCLQAALEAGTAVFIYRITVRLLSAVQAPISSPTGPWNFIVTRERELVAFVAALGWAFFVPAQAYSVILMPTVWLVFVFWFVVWRIVRTETGPTARECLFLGLLMGATAMAVATILFLAPLLLSASFLRRKTGNSHSWRRFLLSAVFFLCGIMAGISPCWIHNYVIARDPVVLSAHSGINFWIGNNPGANGYPRFPPGLRAGQSAMLEDSITSAEAAAGRPLKRAEISAFWLAKARNYIASQPLQWIRLLLTKLRNFWSAFQYDDLSIITSLREQRVLFPGLYFGVVAALGIPGVLLAWRRAPLSRWVTAAILLHIASLMTVFVTERYRMPVVPGLLIFASFGLSLFWRSIISREYLQSSTYLGLLCASTIFVSWPQRDPSLWALDAYNSGWQALESGNLAVAENKLLLARAYVPTNPETNFALGNLRLAQGELSQAKANYVATLYFDRRHKGALNNLGVLAMREADWNLAESYLRAALTIDAQHGKTHYLLAQTLLEKGDRDKARCEIEEALKLRPAQREFIELRNKINKAPAR
jgi:Tetratricopeptide repeat